MRVIWVRYYSHTRERVQDFKAFDDVLYKFFAAIKVLGIVDIDAVWAVDDKRKLYSCVALCLWTYIIS